jgi:hypothetical protein
VIAPTTGQVWSHRLNGIRGAVRIIDVVTDDHAEPVEHLVVFRYREINDRHVAVAPLGQFRAAYVPPFDEPLRSVP